MNEYKDRDPIETYNIIKEFFKSNSFEIVEYCTISCVGTHSCNIKLFDNNNNFILQYNGKGMTKEYSLASGYAELYERFCNKTHFNSIQYYNLTKLELKNGKHSEDVDNLDVTKVVKDKLKSIYSINNKLVLDNYTNVFNKLDTKYINHRVLTDENGSTGMAAGNSLEEALVQGISEIFERSAIDIILSNYNEKLHKLDLNSIDLSENVKSIISKIEHSGKLFIFDLSYSCNLPVLLGVVCTEDGIYCSPGSAPVFSLALERVLTELYQGVKELKDISIFQKPFNSVDFKIQKNSIYKDNSPEVFKENFLINFYEENKCGECFLPTKDYSNKYLLNYIHETFNGYDFYYNDLSLDRNMVALHIYCKQLDFRIKTYSQSSIDTHLNITSEFFKNIAINKTIKYIDLEQYENYLKENVKSLANRSICTLFKDECYVGFLLALDEDPSKIYSNFDNKFYRKSAKIWLQLRYYKAKCRMISDDILKFFNLLDSNITYDDFENSYDFNKSFKYIVANTYLHLANNYDIINSVNIFVK